MKKIVTVNQRLADKVASVLLLGLCVFIFWQVRHFTPAGAAFPKGINIALTIVCAIYFVKSWILPLIKKVGKGGSYEIVENLPAFIVVFPVMIVYVFITLPFLGFGIASFTFFVSLIILNFIVEGHFSTKTVGKAVVLGLVFVFLVGYIFHLLHIRLPEGILF